MLEGASPRADCAPVMRNAPNILKSAAIACAALAALLIVSGAALAALPFSTSAAVLAALAHVRPRYTAGASHQR
jgi:hypothetical protein